jgi:hypothetical protein
MRNKCLKIASFAVESLTFSAKLFKSVGAAAVDNSRFSMGCIYSLKGTYQ